MKKYEFLEHTADVFIVGNGKTLKEAFENCALGLNAYMVDISNVERKVHKRIKAKGSDINSLLVEFLTQFLILHDSENLVFSFIKIKKFDKKNFKIEAIAEGEQFNEKKHTQGTLVKAITYHEMKIEKKEDFYSIKVLVDI